jgi:hypothetical protein
MVEQGRKENVKETRNAVRKVSTKRRHPANPIRFKLALPSEDCAVADSIETLM